MKKRYLIIFVIAIFAIIMFILINATPKNDVLNGGEGNSPIDSTDLGPDPAPVQYKDLILIEKPLMGARVTSPLVVSGKARGNWFFEASFPLTLTDENGTIIAEKYATAEGEWMTTDYVPFTGSLSFTIPSTVTKGYLIFKKDNPSGEPQFDDQVSIPIRF